MDFTKIFTCLLIAFSIVLAGCSRPALAGVQAEMVRAEADPATDYKLGIGDKVRVIVFDEKELSGEFTVTPSGTLSIPLIGEVPATSRSTVDVRNDIQAKYADGFLKNPKISLEVISYRPYYVYGEVKTSGSYPFTVGLTVSSAIATAGGLTPRANKKVVFIRRAGEDSEKPFKFSETLKLFPGDTLRLGERFF